MWKNLQTLYLGISTALIASLFFCNFATIVASGGEELAIAYREKLPYLTMLIMLFTAHVAATASFKVPFLQARVAMIAALMSLGFQIWLAVDIFRFLNEMTFHITALFPLAAAVLNFMAAKRALVDEMTIKAFKSLRSKRRK